MAPRGGARTGTGGTGGALGPRVDVAHHPAVEEYLQVVYHLEETGVPAMRARLVERLGVSAPAVSEQVRRLEREGLVRLGEDRTVALTDRGRAYATAIVRRHRLAERLLVDVLGLPWHQVHAEAGRLEHAISPVLEARLVAVLGDPAVCPHGNPIPGSARTLDAGALTSLDRAPEGARGVVVRIEEALQADHEALLLLEGVQALPGAVVRVAQRLATEVVLDAPGGQLRLPRAAALEVLVHLDGPEVAGPEAAGLQAAGLQAAGLQAAGPGPAQPEPPARVTAARGLRRRPPPGAL